MMLKMLRAMNNAMQPERLLPTTSIDTSALPALQAALWDRHDVVMTAQEVLHLYEDRSIYIDAALRAKTRAHRRP